MSEFDRQVERQVLRTRALCAEDQRDEWKARAEGAEAKYLQRDTEAIQNDVYYKAERAKRERAEQRAERAEAGWRETERELRDDRQAHLVERQELRQRAERAEALLREAAEALEWYSACGYEPRFVDDLGYKWNPEEWQYDSPEIMDDKGEKARAALAKVRDLLEVKHDKG